MIPKSAIGQCRFQKTNSWGYDRCYSNASHLNVNLCYYVTAYTRAAIPYKIQFLELKMQREHNRLSRKTGYKFTQKLMLLQNKQ